MNENEPPENQDHRPGSYLDPYVLARIMADDPEAAKRITIIEVGEDEELSAVRTVEEIGREIPPEILEYICSIFEIPRPGEPTPSDCRTITMPATLMTQKGEEILRTIRNSQGPVAYLAIAKGSYLTAPKHIEDAEGELLFDLAEILNTLIPVMNDREFHTLRLSFEDFNFTPELRLEHLDPLLEKIQGDIGRLGFDRYIHPERLWFHVQGNPLHDPDHPEPPFAVELDRFFLWGLSQYLARRIILKYLRHEGAPCVGCGRETWPVIYRDPSAPGPRGNRYKMCPPCQVAHERSNGNSRTAKWMEGRKSGRKRGRPSKKNT